MSAASSLGALVLAGTRPGGDALARASGVSHKALIDVGGRTMIERVVAALAATPQVERIVIAIERPDVLASLPGLQPPQCRKPVGIVAAAASPAASVADTLEREGTPLLAVTADHALLEPQWLADFLAGCPETADVAFALARKEAVVRWAPEAQRTYLRFADGEYSGCNLFCFRTSQALRVVRFWRTLEAHRKAPLRLMRELGIVTALRYRFGWLRLADALARLEKLTGARIGMVELADGRAAIDVDKPEDLALVRALVGANGRNV